MVMEVIKTNVATGETTTNEEGKEVKVYDEVSAEYDFGDSLADFTDKAGEDATFAAVVSAAKVSLRSRMASLHKAGADVQAGVNEWVYGVATKRVAVDPKATIIAKFAKMSEEEKAAFLEELGA